MSDRGLKISEPGYDVKTAGVENTILTTAGNQFKVHMQGTFTVVVEDGTIGGISYITHSLGYYPACLIYLEADPGSGKKFKVDFTPNDTDQSFFGSHLIGTSDVSVDIYRGNNPATGDLTHNGYYYIFLDSL